VREGVQVKRIEKQQDSWVINDEIQARMLVGAGGHFCPVAKYMSQKDGSAGLVVAQESEFELDATHAPTCAEGTVELIFCRDLEGYAWIFRKQNYLNVGLGRVDCRNLPKHFSQFWDRYRHGAGIASLPARSVHGHAYLLYGHSKRPTVADGIMLIGDAAGLAAPHSGEGIRPAIESGIMAARTILDARPDYSSKRLASYGDAIAKRFNGGSTSVEKLAGYLPQQLRRAVGRRLLRNQRFCRDVVINSWFCGMDQSSVAN
jgi:flavin-dependent dehydrogenase